MFVSHAGFLNVTLEPYTSLAVTQILHGECEHLAPGATATYRQPRLKVEDLDFVGLLQYNEGKEPVGKSSGI